jgi:2-methylcitrate dehydratase PrpD
MTNSLKTQIQNVAAWIYNLKFEDIPEDVVHFSKLQLLDCIAAICAGSLSDVGVKLKEALKTTDSGGPFTLIPNGESWSLDNALYFHAAMINALELDNFLYMGHVEQSAVSVPLALSQKLNSSGKELILAMVAAAEVSGRLGANLVIGPMQGHMRSFIHRAGGATATAKIHGYNETIISQALAIALSMPEHPLYPACFSSDTKVICTSSPTVEGVKAALMAAQGMDGPLDIVENPVGFYKTFSYNKYIPEIWKWLDNTWTLRSLSFKNFATCGYAQGSVNAAVQLKKNYAFSLDEIRHINVYVPIMTMIMEKFSKPHFGAGITPVNTHFSTIRSVAAALIYGEITGDFYRAGTFASKAVEIQKLVDRINLQHDWELTILSMRGIDAGLVNAGKPGFMSLGGSRKTFKQFKKAFGSRPLLQWKDLYDLSKIPGKDIRYFIRRYLKSISIFKFKAKLNSDEDLSHEGDLSQIKFTISGRVELIYSDGKKISETCILPPGFSNDPERDILVKNKFMREAIPVWGEKKALRIMEMILEIENFAGARLLDEIKSSNQSNTGESSDK